MITVKDILVECEDAREEVRYLASHLSNKKEALETIYGLLTDNPVIYCGIENTDQLIKLVKAGLDAKQYPPQDWMERLVFDFMRAVNTCESDLIDRDPYEEYFSEE